VALSASSLEDMRALFGLPKTSRDALGADL
jgi:hypothetical protein